MANEGPTTVGSIIARLSMDRDRWIADKAKTEEEARALGNLHPTIRVDADTAGALAQIEALRAAAGGGDFTPSVGGSTAGAVVSTDALSAAQRRLSAAEAASETATARAILAEMRLAEVQDKRGRTALQVATAEEASRAATARADAAAEKAILAEDMLAAAEKKAAEAALAQAAAQDVATGSTAKANQANSTTVSRMALIGVAVGLLIPLLAPLAGYAVAVSGALAGMGAAGVLAVLGIKNAMAQGTAQGDKYSQGVETLKNDLTQLEGTAATAMLQGFNTAVADITSHMPELNSEIGVFTGQLANAGNSVLSGTINLFRVLNPLFVQAGIYVERLAEGFQSWTQNGGAQKFGDYAQHVFPQVAATLGSLTKGVFDLVGALQPLGQVTLGVVQGIGGLLTFLSGLGTVLPIVVGGLGAAFLAFKAWGLIAPLLANLTLQAAAATTSMTLLGASEMIATGPIGWVVAGITALATIIGVSVIATQNATAQTSAYSDALRQDNGVIGENVRAQAAKALQDAGAFTLAKQLKIATTELTAAVTTDDGARKKLKSTLEAEVIAGRTLNAYAKGSTVTYTEQAKAAQKLLTIMETEHTGIVGNVKAYNDLANATGNTTISTQAQFDAVKQLADRYGMSLPDYMSVVGAQKQTADQLVKTTEKMQLQNDAAGLLKAALDGLNGNALSAADAQNAFDSSLVNMGTHVDAVGKQITFTTSNIEDMSSASVALRGQLDGQIHGLEGVIEANGGLSNSTSAMKANYTDLRQKIIDNAVAHGVDRDAVTQYIDKILQIPTTIPPTKLDIDTSEALAKIAALKAMWATAFGTGGSQTKAQALANAGVNVSKSGYAIFRAGGGTVDGPGSSTSDSVPMWASKGEEVTNALRAGMFRPMLKAINNGSPAQISAQAANLAGPGTSKSITNHWNIQQADISGTVTEIQRRQQQRSA